MTNTRKHNELMNLADNLAEEIMTLSDSEILEELLEDGLDAKEIKNTFSSLLDKAKLRVGKSDLAAARLEMKAMQNSVVNRTPIDGDMARKLIMSANCQNNGMTMAARNAASGQMSDRDALQLLADYEELGVSFETDNDQ